jgi:hypothetical protein
MGCENRDNYMGMCIVVETDLDGVISEFQPR